MEGGRGAEGVAGAAAGELLLEGDAPLLVLRRLLVILGNEKEGGEAGRSIIKRSLLAIQLCEWMGTVGLLGFWETPLWLILLRRLGREVRNNVVVQSKGGSRDDEAWEGW